MAVVALFLGGWAGRATASWRFAGLVAGLVGVTLATAWYAAVPDDPGIATYWQDGFLLFSAALFLERVMDLRGRGRVIEGS